MDDLSQTVSFSNSKKGTSLTGIKSKKKKKRKKAIPVTKSVKSDFKKMARLFSHILIYKHNINKQAKRDLL